MTDLHQRAEQAERMLREPLPTGDLAKVLAELRFTFADLLSALRKENEGLMHDIERHIQIANEYVNDAERYRWLRSRCQYGFEDHDGPQLIHRNGETGACQNANWREDLDAAIDAARNTPTGEQG